jgi:protein SCO1/2
MCPTRGYLLSLMSFRRLFFSFLILISTWCGGNRSLLFAAELPIQVKDVGITEKLGEKVSINDLQFLDEQGQTVTLSKYFSSFKPVILVLVYYSCPNLCNLVLNGLLDTAKQMPWSPGKEYEIVTVSIDPHEGPDVARAKKESYLKAFGKPELHDQLSNGWHFLTIKGDESAIKTLASQVGFGYRYDKVDKQYAHGAVLTLLTPEGRVSRYLYGIEFSTKDLKLGLMEASSSKIGTVMDRVIFYCFHYDPSRRGYALYAFRLVQIASAALVLILAAILVPAFLTQRKGVGQ